MNRIEALLAELCPEGVEVKALGEVVHRTTNIKWSDFEDEEFKYIDLTSVDRVTHAIIQTQTITSKSAPDRAQQIVRQGDVLFGTTRPMLKRYTVVPSEYDGEVCSTGYCVLRPNVGVVLPNFVFHLLGTETFYAHVEANERGASYPAISDSAVKAYRIPVPPLEVQRAIVRMLDTFTALEAELEAELEARRRQYQHYRDALLSFAEDADVRWATLGEVATLITKGTTPKIFADSGINFVKLESFEGGKINPAKFAFVSEETHLKDLKRSILAENDVLFAIAGATIGKCAMVEASILPANTNQALAIVRLGREINARFVFYYMQTRAMVEYIAKYNKTSAQPNLNLQQMSDFPMPLLPLAEQARIVAVLDKFDALVNDLSSGLPAEIAARRQQYEYYRDRLLTFEELV